MYGRTAGSLTVLGGSRGEGKGLDWRRLARDRLSRQRILRVHRDDGWLQNFKYRLQLLLAPRLGILRKSQNESIPLW